MEIQMNRYLSIICIIVAILAVLGFFAYSFLEIYDREVYESPSAEVRSNDYLALERWLSKSGHHVDILPFTNPKDILQIDEDVIIMNSSSFSWTEDTFDELKSLIENGKHFFIFHEYYQTTFHDEDFYSFINHFGVDMITPGDDDASENISESENNFDSQETESSNQNDTELITAEDDDYLYLDQTIYFIIEENRNDILSAGVDANKINLVHIPFGKGSVTFTGSPFFMQNNNLRKNKNRLLAWNLTGAKDEDRQGILFVQEREIQNTFLQDLVNEGNIFPLIISIFILTIICFWGFIPHFGKIITEEESFGKPIRERLIAEAVFLKKFHSLNQYIDVYEKTIQQRFRKNYGEYIDDEKIFCSRLATIIKLDANIIEQSLYPKKKITSRSFAKCIKTIEIILERL
jgi:hypothetical protein